MGVTSKFKNFKASPKTFIAIGVALLIVVGAYAGVKYLLPMAMGRTGNGKLDIDRYAELDCTDAAADAFTEALGSRFRCTGKVTATFHLVMSDGEFVLELDRTALDTELDNFAYDNADAILKNQLSAGGVATDEASLNEYAASIGYADWQSAVWATADAITAGVFQDMTKGDIYYTGTYEISKEGVATYSNDDGKLFTAKSGENGTITVELTFNRQSPEFLYNYFKRGVGLDFEKGSEKDLEPEENTEPGDVKESQVSDKNSGNGITVNFILETVETVEETEPTETTAAPTPTPIPTPTPVPDDEE